jgi:potassium efflux system protein
MCIRRGLIVGLLVTLAAVTVGAQGTANQPITLRTIEGLRSQTANDAAMSEELKREILDHCDTAIAALEQAAANRTARDDFDRARSGVERERRRLQAQLEGPEPEPELPVPDQPSVVQIEDALAAERAHLAASRSALESLQRLGEENAATRGRISQRLGELDLELERLDDELRRQEESAVRADLKAAGRYRILALREAATTEQEMLKARRMLLRDRSILLPIEIDLAQRRVELTGDLVSQLETAAHRLRQEAALESFARIREHSRALSTDVPELAPLASEVEELAEMLWAPDGVVALSEQVVQDLEAARRHQSELNRIAELTARKFKAYGFRGSLSRWWPDIPEDFPEPGQIDAVIDDLEREIPEVEHRMILLEQQRARSLEVRRDSLLQLESAGAAKPDAALAGRVRQLLASRQDLLDDLILRGGRYLDRLVEYRRVAAAFRTKVTEVERFLYAKLLWSRSVPRPIIPRAGDIGAAFGWLVSPAHLQSVNLVGFNFRGFALTGALILIALLLFRQPLQRRLVVLADRVNDPERDSVGHTTRAVAITLALAAPVPLALAITGSFLATVGESAYWAAAARAASEVAMVAALLELARQIFAPRGLAEAHFSWPTHATKPLFRGLIWTEAIGLPLLFVALHLLFAGMRLDSPDNLQAYNNSLGRMAFIAALSAIGLTILGILRPERKVERSASEVRVPWPERFSDYAFPSAFLGAYPLIVVTTLVPSILAAFGFYVTGALFAYQMLRTLLLALVVLIGSAWVHRFRIVRRNRRIVNATIDGNDLKSQKEFEAAERQTRQLFRFAVISVLAFGLFSIWSDALPMLQLLKRVQVVPRIQVIEATDPTDVLRPAPAAESATPETPTGQDGDAAAQDEAADGSPGAAAATNPVTLWSLIEAIIAGLITFVLVKNLPGVIEIILRRRTTLDGGARVAFSTLVRYTISILGTIVVFGLLGLTWSKVQWLAAALTFGLGFGLQEIVANFVSGIILLVERPVRVGDVVTIGNLMGKVTRIQIRATTITLWDRSEMIVPNKEFITTKLVNWTLSDSKRRIEIPLRIAYGADLDEVRSTLVEIAEAHPSVLDEPAPHTLLLAFGEDAIQIELRFVVDFGEGLTTKDQVQMSIDKAFREKGIEFALPKREITLVTGKDQKEGTEPVVP